MAEAHIVRRVDHAFVDSRVNRRNSLSDLYKVRHGDHYITPISDQERANLHQYVDVLMSAITPYRTTVTGDWFYVYTNDLHLCEAIRKLPFVFGLRGTQVNQITVPPDSIVRKRSKYDYRTYFRSKRLSDDDQLALISLIEAQGSEVQVSPRMKWWLENQFHLNLWQGYFIDHNDPHLRVMIELIVPGGTKNTVSIVRDK